ncbi:MAG: caspase family protein, partial [Gammaproteobacteria bacterium]
MMSLNSAIGRYLIVIVFLGFSGCATQPGVGHRRAETFDMGLVKARQHRSEHPDIWQSANGIMVTRQSDTNGLELQKFDIILSYNSQPVHSAAHFIRLTEGADPNSQVEIKIVRNKKLMVSKIDGGPVNANFVDIGQSKPPASLLTLNSGLHSAEINSLSTDKNYKYLLSCSYDKTLRLWKRSNGKMLQVYRVPSGAGIEGQLLSGAISPDAKWVVAGGITGWTWSGRNNLYIFDRKSANLVKTIKGLAQRINVLKFSRNGKYLAAGFFSDQGIRVFDVDNNFKQIFVDKDYVDKVTSIDFDGRGRMLVVARDLGLRLYDATFKLLQKSAAEGGEEPFHAEFSPDGAKIALSFKDNTNVSVLSGKDLSMLYPLDVSKGIDNRSFFHTVTWSPDGQNIYAAGGVWKEGRKHFKVVRRWSGQGKGAIDDFPLANTKITALLVLNKNELAIGDRMATVQVVDASGYSKYRFKPTSGDFRGQKQLKISDDGYRVQFGLKKNADSFIVFDLKKRALRFNASEPDLRSPIHKTQNIRVKRWKQKHDPQFHGKSLIRNPYEMSRTIAIAADESQFVIGFVHSIRLFDSDGHQLWKTSVSALPWSVNLSGNLNYAIAAFADGTIRWYDTKDGSERLALYLYDNGSSWVAWTPQGFFDASPGAEKYIGFQVNHGDEKTPEFVSIDQLYDYFYRPDLVVKALDSNSRKLIADEASHVDVNRILFGGLPPKVNILSPINDTTANSEEVAVKVCVQDQGGGIGNVIYKLNSITLGIDEASKRGLVRVTEENAQCTKIFTHKLAMEDGDNELVVTAFNKDNTIESIAAKATVEFDAPEYAKPDLHVLAIGINNYKDSNLSLRYAVPDARSVVDSIKSASHGLFNNIKIHKLLDANASIASIEEMFNSLSKKIKPNDVFVFFVASHGVTMDGRYYMIPQELVYQNEDSVRENAISQQTLQKWLATIPAKKSLVLLDTCNSG